MDLSNVDDLYEEEDEEDARQRRRRRLVDSVSCLLDLKAASEAPKVTSPLVAFLMGTRRSFKLRRRGRGILTVSNLRRGRRHGTIGSMTNLSLSSSSSTTSPRSSPSASCPPPVSLNFPP